MNRQHRRWHRWLWPLLLPVLAVALLQALWGAKDVPLQLEAQPGPASAAPATATASPGLNPAPPSR